MDEIEKRVKFDLPQSLVDSELNQIIQQNSKNNVEIKKEKVSDKKKPPRKKKILPLDVLLWGYFLLRKVINKITASEKEYQDAVYREAMNYPGKEDEFIKFLDKNPAAKEQISAPIFENKVFDHIVNLTTKTGEGYFF